MALELLIFTCIFALSLGVIGTFLGSGDTRNRRMRAEHEAGRYGKQPWDRRKDDVSDVPGAPVR